MKILLMIVVGFTQIQFVRSQELTINNFSGQTIDFWNDYFQKNTDLHPLEGVYQLESRIINLSSGSEVSNTRKNIIVKVSNSFYRLIDSPFAAFTSVQESKNGFIVIGSEFDNKTTHFNFWGEEINILNDSLLMIKRYPTKIKIKSKLQYRGNIQFNTLAATIKNGIVNFEEKINGYKYIYLLQKIIPNIRKTGTGFQISDRYIVTNSHVISGSQKITLEIDNKEIQLKIEVNDAKNDLAVLSIPEGFLSQPPYGFNQEKIQVGTSVFTIGFPLINTMGTEIKLANGIVSSAKGFDDDVTTFQTSIAVYPGNSGSPLFNENGQVSGIISSKHSEAENASYAIKMKYLFNILDELNIKLPSSSNKSDLVHYYQNYSKYIHLLKCY